ncbi:MAG TPA: IS21-like element helper ATPase IstB [Rhodoglobus sp.]|nr:IS21-like element helper ATPase IstB [Rhodoglobus sp.]
MASDELDRLISLLKRLHLRHLAQNLDDHLQKGAQLKLDAFSFLLRVTEAEVLARNETVAARRIREAHFPEVCRIDTYDFKRQPSLNRAQVLNLAKLSFVDQRQSVIWIGPSGVGKTHLAIGLGVAACQAGYHVRFERAYDLLKRLWASLADDTLEEHLDDLSRPDVLVIDELGNSPRVHEQDFAAVFFELVARRHRRGSFIVTTNLGFDQWASALGTPSQVTPSLDRLIEGAHVITFPQDAPSFRANRTEPVSPLPKHKRRRRSRARPPHERAP